MGRVVFGDRVLSGISTERFTQVDAAHVVRDRHQTVRPGRRQADEPPQSEPTARSYCRIILNGAEHREPTPSLWVRFAHLEHRVPSNPDRD